MMHPELEGLIRAVAAEPADDSSRLIMADWCEDHGMADRAEFIRLQIRLAAGEPVPARSLERESVLLDRLGYGIINTPRMWKGPMAYGLGTHTFTRGFISKWRMRLDQWAENGRDVVQWHPLEAVDIVGVEPEEWPGSFSWFLVGFSHDRATIPGAIFERLQGMGISMIGRRIRYASAREAVDDLNRAALEWARS